MKKPKEDFEAIVREVFDDYCMNLSDERRRLFDRYQFEDAALKVVGIGSVGTRCLIVLFFSEDNHPLMLQFKQARRSVLEPYTQKSQYDNQGQRVVIAQRLTHSSMEGLVRQLVHFSQGQPPKLSGPSP